jgi:hypothetical protein
MTWRWFVMAALLAGGCTARPEALPSPAPTPCPEGIVRADTARVTELADVLQGHVPEHLPAGFGLAEVWGRGDRTLGDARWTDGRCRTIEVLLAVPGALPPGPRLGEWVVAINAAGQCGNGVLGEGSCLRYVARVDNHTLWVNMIGVDRSQGDGVVLSIPV